MSLSPKYNIKRSVRNIKSPFTPTNKNLESFPFIHSQSFKTFSEFRSNTEFSTYDAELLCGAKCRDLNIIASKDHKQKFLNNFFNSIKGRKLNFQGAGLGKNSAEVLRKIIKSAKNYTHLMLSNNNLGDEGCEKVVKVLKSNLNFIHVDLSGNNLTAEGSAVVIARLLNNQSVISLDLSSVDRMNKNRIGGKGSQILSNLLYRSRILTFLNLSGTGIGKEGLDFMSVGLALNSSLMSLNLSFNNLEGKHLHLFCFNLAKSQVKELFLSGNPIGLKGCESLSNLIAFKFDNKCPLTKLELARSEIDEESLNKLAFALENNSTISELNLSFNPLGSKSCSNISKALMHNSCLKTLNLSTCGLKEDGAQRLSEGLIRNFSLKSLNLSNNYLFDAGAKHLSEGLKKNKGLEVLDLSSNMIKNPGGQAIIEGLFLTPKLNTVNLNNNSLKNEIGHDFLALVSRCKNFLSVSLEFNSINLKYVNLIKQCLLRNSQILKSALSPKIKNDIEKMIISEEYIDGIFKKITLTEKMKEDVHVKFFKQRTRFFDAKNEEIDKFEEVKVEKNQVLSRKQTITKEADVTYFDISKTKFQKEKEIKDIKESTSTLIHHLNLIKKKSTP